MKALDKLIQLDMEGGCQPSEKECVLCEVIDELQSKPVSLELIYEMDRLKKENQIYKHKFESFRNVAKALLE